MDDSRGPWLRGTSKRLFVALTLVAATAHAAHAKVTQIQTAEYRQIFDTIKTMGESQPAASILLVFDIDKTLLITNNCIPDFQIHGLADWGRMISECPSSLTEDLVQTELRVLQRSGFATIALTARPSTLVAATERELNRNQLTFLDHPYSAADNLSETWGTIRVNFKNGVLYAAGRDKGVVLREFLTRKSPDRHRVVFVDDDPVNIRAVTSVFQDDQVNDVHIFHYNRYSE